MLKSCIKTDKIIRYAQGISDSEEKKKIEKHLLKCSLCMERLSETVNSLYDTDLNEYKPLPKNEAAKIAQQINQLSFDNKFLSFAKIQKVINTFTLKLKEYYQNFLTKGSIQYNWYGLEPQLISYRSQSSKFLEYFYHKERFHDILLKFYFEKTTNNCFNMQLAVQSKNQNPMIRITLKQKNGGRTSQLVGASGEWIKNVQFGEYLLSVEENAIQKGECFFNILANSILFDKKQMNLKK